MADARRPPTLPLPDAGPFRASFWRSPLRGPWLASFLSAALLPLIVVCAVTGLLSHAAYEPGLGNNALFDEGVDLYFFSWPVRPAWLYAVTQGLHIVTGLAAVPILLAKLWAVIPQLFERPARAIAGPRRRAAQPGSAGRRQPVPVRHRHPQHPALVPVRLLLRARALLRGVRVHGRADLSHRVEGRYRARARFASAACCARCATTSSTPSPSPRSRDFTPPRPWRRRRPP
ncbi:MAG: hypothetical protein WKF40_03330 [Thermoleophilaceae bacterium]